ncbi:MAG: DUF1015 domain-containing protein [Candidatus Omnitrophica bacterium]|nr:DUF1015 domain-containing protein [Candidatus Omnitrophota bacterium]
MSAIKPFQAIHYNVEKVGDLSKVICPPYDVISAAQQNDYYKQNPYNFIRVSLPKDADHDPDRKYNHAQETLGKWLQEGALIQDQAPSIYYYRQEYKIMGEKHSRLGFLAAMRLPDEKDSKIFPHENTHAKAKEDRLKLWTALSANESPIFVCFSDREKCVEKIFLKHVAPSLPLMNVVDQEGVRHILWALSDPQLIAEIAETMTDQHLFIADGHHRFEVACEYRRIQQAKHSKNGAEAPYNYVMTYFTNMDSKDLKILPMHRIIKTLPKSLDFLEEFFRVDKIKTKDQLSILLIKAGKNEHAFGLYMKDQMLLLRLKNKALIDQYIAEGSANYRRLDATILKYFVLDRLGIKSEDILYTKDADEVTGKVDRGEAAAGFIMNSVRMEQLRDIALQGEKMPPKTTYFYPKAWSGLTMYRLA